MQACTVVNDFVMTLLGEYILDFMIFTTIFDKKNSVLELKNSIM